MSIPRETRSRHLQAEELKDLQMAASFKRKAPTASLLECVLMEDINHQPIPIPERSSRMAMCQV
ncbi:hypothetical protein D3C81_2159500 [compost metagenome]|nr:hypothetical protein [Stenotrophomonas sp.]